MSDFEDLREDGTADMADMADMATRDTAAAASAADDSAAGAPINPRKRKKSSRASVPASLFLYRSFVGFLLCCHPPAHPSVSPNSTPSEDAQASYPPCF